MDKIKSKRKKEERRKIRVRSKIFGTAEKPRMSIFKSNAFIYIQFIDDFAQKTLVSVSTAKIKEKGKKIDAKELSGKLGEMAAKEALAKGIKMAVLDRGSYKYHGNVKAIAGEIRKGGVKI